MWPQVADVYDWVGFCDGTHRKEEGIKKYNEFLLKANGALKQEKENAQIEKERLEVKRMGNSVIYCSFGT